jgi:hypothetical protein
MKFLHSGLGGYWISIERLTLLQATLCLKVDSWYVRSRKVDEILEEMGQ